jgi:hypothetical protein
MTLTYMAADEVAKLLHIIVEEGACPECHYAYTYELEGCDACRPITDVLEQHGLTDEEDR